MADQKTTNAMHSLVMIILLVGAIVAYSLGFAKDMRSILIGGVIFEVSFWLVVVLSRWKENHREA